MSDFGHYFRACPHERIDVYRVLQLFGVTDPCLQHAVKKLIVAGARGHKDIERDVGEAIATLKRWQEMRQEDLAATTEVRVTGEFDRRAPFMPVAGGIW